MDHLNFDAPSESLAKTQRNWAEKEREEVTSELENTVSLLQATLDATADGVLAVAAGGGIVAYNQQFLTMWRIPEELTREKDDRALLAFVLEQVSEPDLFLKEAEKLVANPLEPQLDFIHFKDGRIFERYTLPQKVGDKIIGSVKSFRDVTQREKNIRQNTFLLEATRLLSSLEVEKAIESVVHLAIPLLGDACILDRIREGKPQRIAHSGNYLSGEACHLPAAAIAGRTVLYRHRGRQYLCVPIVSKNEVVAIFTFQNALEREYQPSEIQLAEEISRRSALSFENAQLYRSTKEAIALRDEFLTLAVHEIRGPITALKLASQTVLDGRLGQENLKRMLTIIQNESEKLGRFVEELLNFGRIRSGQFTIEKSQADLAQIINTVMQTLQPELQQSGSQFTLRCEEPVIGHWDPFRLEQLVRNLLENAIKFGLGKPIEVALMSSDGAVTLRVIDQGIGVPANMTDRIFTPFGRAVSVRNFGGLGLGLYIARSIAEGMGGTVTVDSHEGTTVFSLTLPRSAA